MNDSDGSEGMPGVSALIARPPNAARVARSGESAAAHSSVGQNFVSPDLLGVRLNSRPVRSLMGRSGVFGIVGLVATVPAHAHGEGVIWILGIDVLLLLVAIAVIAFALKCPAWVRLLLSCVYVATLAVLLFLPIQLFPSLGPLNGPLHFALPWLVSGAAFLIYRVFRREFRNEAT